MYRLIPTLRVGVIVALVAVITGCGSSSSSTSNTAAAGSSLPNTTTPPPATTTTAPAKPKHKHTHTTVASATPVTSTPVSSSSTGSSAASSGTAPKRAASNACGPAGSTKAGGQLVIYGNSPPPQFKPVLDGFAKAYPSVKVSYSDQADNVSFSKYRAEHAQGARTADMIIASSPLQWDNNKDIALCFKPDDAAAYPSFRTQFPGVFILSPDPAVSLYSKAKLPANRVPTTFAQLTREVKQDPALFNKKIATYTVNNDFGYTAFWGMAQQHGWSILNALGPASKPQADGTAIAEQIASGASNYAFFESGLIRGAVTGAVANVVGWVYMHDFTPLIPRGAAVTKGAANPAAAEAFLNWAYSATGQQVLCAAGFTAFRSGVSCANSMAAVQQAVGAANVYLVPFHSTIAQDQQSFVGRWHKVFG
jgi:iron(III) transport system substrate-binding protein